MKIFIPGILLIIALLVVSLQLPFLGHATATFSVGATVLGTEQPSPRSSGGGGGGGAALVKPTIDIDTPSQLRAELGLSDSDTIELTNEATYTVTVNLAHTSAPGFDLDRYSVRLSPGITEQVKMSWSPQTDTNDRAIITYTYPGGVQQAVVDLIVNEQEILPPIETEEIPEELDAPTYTLIVKDDDGNILESISSDSVQEVQAQREELMKTNNATEICVIQEDNIDCQPIPVVNIPQASTNAQAIVALLVSIAIAAHVTWSRRHR